MAFSKPGRYYLKRIRIDYTTDGHQGWQYQDIDTTVVISDPPDPGPKPLPSSAVCGLRWSRFRRRYGANRCRSIQGGRLGRQGWRGG